MYGRSFAKVYNKWWIEFATIIAPRIFEYYELQPISEHNKSVLDLCCGTGQLALYFLKNGYKTLGIDLSEYMLAYARMNTAKYIEKGLADFKQGDVTAFSLDSQFGLVVSTFDSLNHLENFEALENCFHCVYKVLLKGGLFIFDLNTRTGLDRWNEIFIQDTEEAMIVTRGIYDGKGDKAWTKVSGFIQADNGTYERFDEIISNTTFELERVKKKLHEIGWARVQFTQVLDLDFRLEEPERERRVVIIAAKPF
ncbi:MAG: class I SAM-dependent DNA methyltransferase [Candidatus Hodarchaeota archaeon]